MRLAISIDIGGTNTKLGVVTPEGEVLYRAGFSTQSFPEQTAFFQKLVHELNTLVGWVKYPCTVAGIGLGAPRANFFTGSIEGAANLRWQQPLALREKLKEAFGLPVFITKDANLAALGEKHYGAAKAMQNFISVTLGTGVGSGVYMNGQLLHGQSDAVGELGHTTLKVKGRQCRCGKKGCLETYVSVEGLKRTMLSLLAKDAGIADMQSLQLAEASPASLYKIALEGNDLARKVFASAGKHLGMKLAELFILFNPEAIFLSGGLANAGDLLRLPAQKALKKQLYNSYPDEPLLLLSALKENESSLLGGGALVWEQLKNEENCLV